MSDDTGHGKPARQAGQPADVDAIMRLGRRVLVTGGALRLGARICEAFGAAGWQVFCHYHRSLESAQSLERTLAARGMNIELVQADLGEEAERVQMMDRIQERHGPLRALVNNASLFEPDSGTQWSTDLVRRQLEVNLLAPLDLARRLASPDVLDGPGLATTACVIHVLDQKVFNLNPDYFSYTVSKLALERAVALQAQALAPRVRVCGLAPGLMFESGPQSTENFQRASRVNLLRRPIDPDSVAHSAVFLAENDAITGTTLSVDNGQHLVPLERDVMFVVDELVNRGMVK